MEEELTSEQPKDVEADKTSSDVYLELLNATSYPESPSDLPQSFKLPPEISTAIEKMVLSSLSSREEVSQFVYWDSKDRKFKFGKMHTGNKANAGIVSAAERARVTTGASSQRPLIDFHTHPEDRLSPFSAQDIASAKAGQSSAYINIVGSKLGIFALLATEASQARSLPKGIGFILGALETSKARRKLQKEGYMALGYVEDNVRLIENQGLGLYVWKTPSQFSIFGLQEEDMKKGIELKRVGSQRPSSGNTLGNLDF